MVDYLTPQQRTPVGRTPGPSGRGAAAIGRAGQGLAAAIGQAGQDALQREERSAIIHASAAMAEARQHWAQELQRRSEEAEGEAAGFAQSLDDDFGEYRSKAIEQAPQMARERLATMFDQLGTTVGQRALGFEAQKRVAFRQRQIADTVQLNVNTVLSDPSQFDVVRAETRVMIDAAGLPEETRAAVMADAEAGLATAHLERLIETAPGQAYSALRSGRFDQALAPNVKARLLVRAKGGHEARYALAEGRVIADAMDGYAGDAASLLRSFEGFEADTYWDVDHHRVGFGSDTITRADGTVVTVEPGMRITRADAERDLQRRIGTSRATIRSQVGEEGWAALTPEAQDALISVTYNYGSLRGERRGDRHEAVIAAARAGDIVALADAVEALGEDNGGVNRDRRATEAAIIRGSAPMEWIEAQVAGIEDPVLRDKVRREAAAEWSLGRAERDRRAAGAAIQAAERGSSLETAVRRGDLSHAEIEAAWEAGDITAAKRVQLTAIADGVVAGSDRAAAEMLADRREADRARLDADLGVRVSEGLAGRDEIDMARRTGIIDDKRWESLTEQHLSQSASAARERAPLEEAAAWMARDGRGLPQRKAHRDHVDLLYDNREPGDAATDRAAAMALISEKGIAPQAFTEEIRFGIAAGDQAAFDAAEAVLRQHPQAFTGRSGSAEIVDSVEKYRGLLRLHRSPEEAIRRVNPSPEARQAGEALDVMIREEADDLEVGHFKSVWVADEISDADGSRLLGDYRALYGELRRDGHTADEAKEIARERLQRTWGPSQANGGRLMRHPLERHYPAGADGTHDYVLADLLVGLAEAEVEGVEEVRLVASGMTGDDVRAGVPPRYSVMYLAEGRWQMFPRPFRPDPSAETDKRAMQFTEARALETWTQGMWPRGDDLVRMMRRLRGNTASAGRNAPRVPTANEGDE